MVNAYNLFEMLFALLALSSKVIATSTGKILWLLLAMWGRLGAFVEGTKLMSGKKGPLWLRRVFLFAVVVTLGSIATRSTSIVPRLRHASKLLF